MANIPFSLPLFIQRISWKIIHMLENFVVWAYKKVFTRRKGNPLGSGLVEANGDLSSLSNPTCKLGHLGKLISCGSDCWSLWREAGDWGFDSSLMGKGFWFGLFFSSWTRRTGCNEQMSLAWGLSCSSRQGSGRGLPYGSWYVKYRQAIISRASWGKKKGKSKHPRKETCEGLNKVVLSFVPHGP